MSTVAELLAKPGPGVAFYFAVSLDHGATISYYYSRGGYLPSVGADPRVVSIGPVDRSFGSRRGLSSTSFEVRLDNTDGTLDWISNRDTYASQFAPSQWTLVAYVFDPLNLADATTKILGYFRPTLEPPRRDNSSITFTLADQLLTDLQLADLPTVRDWMNTASTDWPYAAAIPVAGQQIDPSFVGAVPDFNVDAPVQLAFGSNAVPMTRVFQNVYVICAVKGAAGALPMALQSMRFGNGYAWLADSSGTYLQKTVASGPTIGNVWNFAEVHRSETITKNGEDWHLMWLELNAGWDDLDVASFLSQIGYDKVYAPQTDAGTYEVYDQFGPLSVHGYLWSHPTNDVTSLYQGLNAATVAQDLLTYYCRRSLTIDTDSFDRVLAARPDAKASGVVRQGISVSTSRTGGTFFELMKGELAVALAGICDVGDFDLFLAWDGSLAASALVNDYTAQTAMLSSLDETLVTGDVSERIPGEGERGRPYNRLFVVRNGQRFGPLDDTTAISTWGNVVVEQFDGTWIQDIEFVLQSGVGSGNGGRITTNAMLVIYGSRGGSTVRPRVSVRTFLNGLNFELGDYITFSWTRGGLGTPYDAAIFRIEGIRLDPSTNQVGLELLWLNDLRSTSALPYVLDDETLSTRSSGSGGRTCTVTTGSNTIAFSSGSLITDGVAAGDHIILTDSTEAATTFKRYRALLISSVTDATHLVINSTYSSNDFGSAGPYATSAWEIRRGALTYRSSATVYGKVGDSTHPGKFSDNTTYAYVLLDG